MAYEIATPVLQETVTLARAAAAGIQDGTLDTKPAHVLLGAGRVMQGAVREDVRARLAAPRIKAAESRGKA